LLVGFCHEDCLLKARKRAVFCLTQLISRIISTRAMHTDRFFHSLPTPFSARAASSLPENRKQYEYSRPRLRTSTIVHERVSRSLHAFVTTVGAMPKRTVETTGSSTCCAMFSFLAISALFFMLPAGLEFVFGASAPPYLGFLFVAWAPMIFFQAGATPCAANFPSLRPYQWMAEELRPFLPILNISRAIQKTTVNHEQARACLSAAKNVPRSTFGQPCSISTTPL